MPAWLSYITLDFRTTVHYVCPVKVLEFSPFLEVPPPSGTTAADGFRVSLDHVCRNVWLTTRSPKFSVQSSSALPSRRCCSSPHHVRQTAVLAMNAAFCAFKASDAHRSDAVRSARMPVTVGRISVVRANRYPTRDFRVAEAGERAS